MAIIKGWDLRTKIIFFIFAIGGLAAILLFYIYIRTQQNIIQTMTEQKVKLLDSTVEHSISLSMEEGQVEEVQEILERIASHPDINGLRIFSPQGIILRSSDPREIRNKVNGIYLKKIQRLNSEKIKFYLDKSNALIRSLKPIPNKPKCYRCHSPEIKYLGILNADINYSSTLFLLQKNQQIGIMIAIFSLAVLTVIIIHLSDKLINEPIAELEEKMKKVQNGNLNLRVNIPREDEIGHLGKSFNLMVKKLDEAHKKIKEMHFKEMQRAEHLASMGEMATGLAHEIKNPIAGIKSALEIIAEEISEENSHKEIITEVLNQTERIDTIIQDLLSYAKPKEPKFIQTDINKYINQVIKLAKTQIKDKDIEVSFTSPTNITYAHLDPDQIQQVLLNLILNSIQAINSQGKIEIKISESKNNSLKIIISDNGQGIKSENLSKIFKPFFTTKHRGTGLGLSICKRIIENHQGTIEVKSEEGKGTTFSISLPLLKSEVSKII
ncbi:MAG: PAS domain-containing sensor histidine kinase [Candidatus Aminicenantia bacterium]